MNVGDAVFNWTEKDGLPKLREVVIAETLTTEKEGAEPSIRYRLRYPVPEGVTDQDEIAAIKGSTWWEERPVFATREEAMAVIA